MDISTSSTFHRNPWMLDGSESWLGGWPAARFEASWFCGRPLWSGNFEHPPAPASPTAICSFSFSVWRSHKFLTHPSRKHPISKLLKSAVNVTISMASVTIHFSSTKIKWQSVLLGDEAVLLRRSHGHMHTDRLGPWWKSQLMVATSTERWIWWTVGVVLCFWPYRYMLNWGGAWKTHWTLLFHDDHYGQLTTTAYFGLAQLSPIICHTSWSTTTIYSLIDRLVMSTITKQTLTTSNTRLTSPNYHEPITNQYTINSGPQSISNIDHQHKHKTHKTIHSQQNTQQFSLLITHQRTINNHQFTIYIIYI